METTELLEIIHKGEDSRHQFKVNFTNVNSLAAEIVAFSNTNGGMIIIGVSDAQEVIGLKPEDVGRLNQLISNAASQSVRPSVNPYTENVSHPNGIIMIVEVPKGINKPYMDISGATWVKSGADKRRVTSREEMQRLFQATGLIHGDAVPANGMTADDIDRYFFDSFLEKEYEENLEIIGKPLPSLLENMNLCKDSVLNVAGALLFAKNPSFKLPSFIVKAVSYPGTDIDVESYLDSRDITGKLSDVFTHTLGFFTANLRHIQGQKGVNTTGDLEIPKIVFEELVVNALIHRDYFISAPVRIFLYCDRIEIISPGHLPNFLTVENIKAGNSNIRNPILASYATKILPYRGLGSGIRRALKAYPDIDLIDDRDGNTFTVVIYRNNR